MPRAGERRSLLWLAIVVAVPACELAEVPTPVGNNVCEAPTTISPLPAALEETSGVTASRAHSGVYWTHNDSGGEPAVFAIDSAGRVLARVLVRGATNRDWEDIAVGPCEPGSERDCVFIAETGDNSEQHPHVAAYRVPEPDPATDTVAGPADIFRFTYPQGPRDAEAMYVTDTGIHVVNKGRSDAIELFRLRPPYRPGATQPLERVQRLAPPPTSVSAQVTAAGVDPTGQRVAIRTYSGLRFYDIVADTLELRGRPADLVAPGQMQGEGVDLLDDERVVVTGEAQGPRPPTVGLVACDPMRPPADTASGGS